MKKKSALQKRREDPNSKLWRNKCDKLWRDSVIARDGNKCILCGSDRFVQAHHIIPREMHSHRHILNNGVSLCCKHHKYSYEISAHKASIEFYKWMMSNKKDVWDWLLEQKPTKQNTVLYKDRFDILITEFKQITSPN